MPDKEYKIKLSEDGADKVAKSFGGVDEAVEGVGKAAEDAADPLDQLLGRLNEIAEAASEGDAAALEEAVVVIREAVEELENVDSVAPEAVAELDKMADSFEEVANEAREAEQALQQMTRAESEAADEAARLNRPLTKQEMNLEAVTRAFKKKTKALGPTASSLQKVAGRADEVASVMGQMPGPVGGAAQAIQGVLSVAKGHPILTAAALALTAVAIGAKKIYDHYQRVKEVAKVGLPELAKSTKDAAIEANRLEQSQRRAAEAIRNSNAGVSSYVASLRQAASAQASLTDAELGGELALIDLAELEGNLTEAEALRARFDARRTAAEKKRAMEREQLEKEVEITRREEKEATEDWRETFPAARAASMEFDLIDEGNKRQMPKLHDKAVAEQEANKAYIKAKEGSDPEKAKQAKQAAEEASQALQDAYDEIHKAALEAREVAFEATREARRRANEKTGERRAAEDALTRFDGFGQKTFDAQQGTESTRLEIEEVRREKAAEAKRQAAEKQAAQQRIDELETQGEVASQEVGALAERAGEVTANVESGGGARHQGDREALTAIREALDALADGVDSGETEALSAAIESAANQTQSAFDVRDGVLRELVGKLEASVERERERDLAIEELRSIIANLPN